jgi:hypothetical protein
MINPYQEVDWKTVKRVASATHMHIKDRETLENGYKYGLRHFPISNYYPSAPYNRNPRLSDFKLKQSWSCQCNGKLISPPINWNNIITWNDELEEEAKQNLPFTEEDAPFFTNMPDDIIISANAEHHGFNNSDAHICCPGSSFASGNFDIPPEHYKLHEHGFARGFGGSWQEAFQGMIDKLDYPDAGGITINHPTWFSRLSDEEVIQMLDFDDRVLGIEIYNDLSATRDYSKYHGYIPPLLETDLGFSLKMWDRILATGRRCWGYCVPDHSVGKMKNWTGRSILLVDEFTEHNCLKALRNGNFYGSLHGTDLTIEDLVVNETFLLVRVNKLAIIRFISEQGIIEAQVDREAHCRIPAGTIYLRLEIEDFNGEKLFTQPIMLGQ